MAGELYAGPFPPPALALIFVASIQILVMIRGTRRV